MSVVPPPPTFSPGIITSTQLNQLSAAITYLQAPPRFRGRQTSAQTLSSSVWTAVLLDTEDVDLDVSGVGPGHSTSTNTSRFTANYPGWYLCSGGVGFSSLATPAGRRGVRWSVNGTTVRASAQQFQSSGTSAGSYSARAILVYLGPGDYVEMYGFFEGGGTLALNVTDHNDPSADVIWMSNA